MTIFLTVLGAALIIIALQDLFHTLFHPSATGDISDWIAHVAWKTVRMARPGNLGIAGPMAFLLTVSYWAASLVLGFALIYRPRLPSQFSFAAGLNPQSYDSLAGSINISLGALMTISTTAQAKMLWIQFLMEIEAVFGFGLLTASVSWILSIYPVLEHRRSLAHQATLLHFSEVKGVKCLEDTSDSELQELLLEMASQLSTHRNELTQFPITYYFYEQEKETALAGVLPYMADIAEQSLSRPGAAGLSAAVLGGAIDDYLKVLADRFLHTKLEDRREVLRAYAEDHKREVVRSPRLRPKAA
jgi:hypothetical protein